MLYLSERQHCEIECNLVFKYAREKYEDHVYHAPADPDVTKLGGKKEFYTYQVQLNDAIKRYYSLIFIN